MPSSHSVFFRYKKRVSKEDKPIPKFRVTPIKPGVCFLCGENFKPRRGGTKPYCDKHTYRNHKVIEHAFNPVI